MRSEWRVKASQENSMGMLKVSNIALARRTQLLMEKKILNCKRKLKQTRTWIKLGN